MVKLLVTTAVIVFFATLVDLSFLHYQATVGKSFWKMKIFPDIGSLL
jgi:hypothetical protein